MSETNKNANSAVTSKQFIDAVSRILEHALAKGELPNADVLKDITTSDLLLWSSSLIHIGNKQPSEPIKYPVWVDTNGTPIMKYRVDKSDGGFDYIETTSGKSAYTIAVENGFTGGDEKAWLASLVGQPGPPGDAGESAFEAARKGGYTGNSKSEFYSLLASLSKPTYENVTFIHYGDEEPEDENLQFWADTSATPAVWKYKDTNGNWIRFAGGSSAGSESNIKSGIVPSWNEKTISYGTECIFDFEWYCLEDEQPVPGLGSFTLYRSIGNGKEEELESFRIDQKGNRSINLRSYLSLGDNEFILQLIDRFGTPKRIYFTVKTVKLSLEKAFPTDMPYRTNPVIFKCRPEGASGITKTLHIELDGKLAATRTFDSSGSTIEVSLTINEHGAHSVRAYYTCQLAEGEEPVPSEIIYQEFAFLEEGNTEPIITADLGTCKLKEFETCIVHWSVFTPDGDGTVLAYTPSVKIYESTQDVVLEGATPLTIENAPQGKVYDYDFKAVNLGRNYIIFVVGDYSRLLPIDVEKNVIDVSAQTEGLTLHLTSAKRDNGDTEGRDKWIYGEISAELRNFNFDSDGWVLDNSQKNKVLRLMDEAEVYIDHKIFTSDIATSGATIEFELATSDVLDDEAEVLRCMQGNIGVSITAKQAVIRSSLEYLSVPFRDGEHIRITFVIEPVNSLHRLMSVYINGVWSGTKRFAANDKFSQTSPQGITIGSKFCTTDIYCIRVYNTVLSRRAILDNWIADTQDPELLLQRAKRNDIFSGDLISIDKLPEKLPYMVVNAGSDEDEQTRLPQSKGDKKIRSGYFVYPSDASKSFDFVDAKWDVQGTSSQFYPKKNYKVSFPDGGIKPADGGSAKDEILMFKKGIPTNVYCLKTDFASCEGANNVELVDLFNEIAPPIPPQVDNDAIRQGIAGFPMVLFRYDGTNYYFIGKYNFNNDKSTSEVFGMYGDVESWEVTKNATALGKYQSDDFDRSEWDADKGKWVVAKENTYEARYPDPNDNYENLKRMVSWVYSTWRDGASKTRTLDTPVTYGDITYEYDDEDYRKAKFINEIDDYFDREHLVFFYTFTHFFLMIDNREKNTFPTLYFNKEKNKWLWYMLPYDFDTAMGIDNSGNLTFGHELEDTDVINGDDVFNGAKSVLFCNVRDYLGDEVRDTYRKLRNEGKLSYNSVKKRFDDHQSSWGEALFNEDSYFKYIEPNNSDDHAKLQGNKSAQRDYWTYYRFKYFDSMYTCGDTKSNYIFMRPHVPASIYLKPYADTYGSISFDSDTEPAAKRMLKKDGFCEFKYPTLDIPDDAVVNILNCDMISDIRGLPDLHLSEFRGAMATKLQSLIIGHDTDENPDFDKIELGDNRLLKLVNLRNCINFKQVVDLSGCSRIEEVYLERTQTTACILPRGGSCKILHLPSTVKDLTVINHKVTDFSMTDYEGNTSYNNLTTLWLDLNETSKSTFDIKTMVNTMIEKFKASENEGTNERGRLRLTKFELLGDKGFETAQDILDFYADINHYFIGLNDRGTDQDKVELSGKIEVAESPILGTQLNQMKKMFPEVDIIYKSIQSQIVFFDDEEHSREPFYTQIVFNNGDAVDPTVTLGKEPTRYAPTDTNNGGTEDSEARYVFIGWSESIKNVTTYREVHAIYRKELKYRRSFLDKDNLYIPVNGEEVNIYYDTDSERYVVEPPKHETWRSEVMGFPYDNIFTGWTDTSGAIYASQVPDISTGCSTNIIYTPTFRQERVYVVTFKDGSRVINTEDHYLDDTLSKPLNPTKARTDYHTYHFIRWVDEEGNEITDFSNIVVKNDITIYADFEARDIYYSLVFRKHNGTVLQTFSNKLYREDYGNLYTGVTTWESYSPRYKKEELKGWRISTESKNGTYYLYYTASLYTEEKATLTYSSHSIGAYNVGEPEYVCDGKSETRRGLNIDVVTLFQIHSNVRMHVTLSDLPLTTVINGFKVYVYTDRAGRANYRCRFRTYFSYYNSGLTTNPYPSLGGTSYIEDSTESGSRTYTRTESALSQALSWMNTHINDMNNLYLEVEGSNIWVKETEATFYYTT